MFVPLWLVFMGSGLVMAVVTVLWAIESGQFEDQDRARFLPLSGLTAGEMSRAPRRDRASTAGMTAIFVVGGVAIAAALLLTFRHM